MENEMTRIFLMILCGMFLLFLIINHLFINPHKTSNVLNVLMKHFRIRNEQPMEFRIIEEKAKNKYREFEVKTIHQKFYRVVIKGLKVQNSVPIDGFTINEQDWYMRGKVNPIDFNKFSITVKEKFEELS